MAKKRITSRPGLFGYTNYYDEKGQLVGKSRPGAFGATVYFDEKGRLVGKSHKGLFAKEVYRDIDFKRYIATYSDFVGESHYENGKRIGCTRPGFWGMKYTTLESEETPVEEEISYTDDDFEEDDCEEDLEEDYREEDSREAAPPADSATISKNIQLFILCVIICLAIACVYRFVQSQ